MEILDFYVKSAPSAQNAIDIFKGEWASKLPNELSFQCVAGITPLFEDMRISWAVKQIGGVSGKTVLELGPLEAGHTYMMEKLGASAITSVESNSRAYLKCLIIKELLELKRSRFLSGDFVEYLKTSPGKFDFGIASGVLYHMINPVELIHLLSQSCNQIYIWTHYYDQIIIENNPRLNHKFISPSTTSEFNGFKHTLYRQEYEKALSYSGFCGGSSAFSYWLSRADLLSCLEYFGFKNIIISDSKFDSPQHTNGPCISLVAMK